VTSSRFMQSPHRARRWSGLSPTVGGRNGWALDVSQWDVDGTRARTEALALSRSRPMKVVDRNSVVPGRCRRQTGPMLLTVAGSSCSGKTTAARAWAGFDGLVLHDFDEIGVPSTADVPWRQRSLEQWLQRVVDYQDQGVDVLLLGQSPLGEVLASPSAMHLNGIAACLLDVADDERLRRLERRDPGKWRGEARRSFIGWARWHRGHAADPRYRPEVITTGGWRRMVWERWSSWTSSDPRWTVTVVDTTGRTVEQSSAELHRWVQAARADLALGRLALARDWARN
jgi:hypothetical protein